MKAEWIRRQKVLAEAAKLRRQMAMTMGKDAFIEEKSEAEWQKEWDQWKQGWPEMGMSCHCHAMRNILEKL
jgi:hypothetical protein